MNLLEYILNDYICFLDLIKYYIHLFSNLLVNDIT